MSKLIFCKFLSKYKCARVYGVDSQWYGRGAFLLGTYCNIYHILLSLLDFHIGCFVAMMCILAIGAFCIYILSIFSRTCLFFVYLYQIKI